MEVKKEELRLAQTLIQASVVDKADFAEYENRHLTDLKKSIAAKVKGKKIAFPDQAEAPPRTINILDALQQRLAQKKGVGR